ncbi:MAG TPA: Uma2 family endonuclease [Verrucomicrobiota bacterium]|nr:Uma2 family endonuclease [Verrucomicrobiota bacterium]
MDTLVEQVMKSPRLPEIVDDLRARLSAERIARRKFYEEIGDGEKWEFINGRAIMHSPDTVRNILIRSLIENLLANYVRRQALGIVLSEKGLCVFPRNDFMPDVVFYSSEKAAVLKPTQLKLPPPDLAVEVLSPSTAKRDRGVKFKDYEAHGVGEYWIVDPDRELIEQYVSERGAFVPRLKSGQGVLASSVVPGFRVPVRALFDPAANDAALDKLRSMRPRS